LYQNKSFEVQTVCKSELWVNKVTGIFGGTRKPDTMRFGAPENACLFCEATHNLGVKAEGGSVAPQLSNEDSNKHMPIIVVLQVERFVSSIGHPSSK
jgi:hypothetical protein